MWAAVSPDNLQVASISWDGTARIWDASSGACLHVLGPFGGQLWCGAFSPDAKYLAISQGNPKTYVHVYETGTGHPVSRFEGFRRAAHSLAWSPDGTMIACGADRGELCIWDPYTGKERMRWRLAFDNPLMSRFAMVRKVQFVDGGRKLIFQISEGTVELYDFESNLKKQFTRRAEDKVDTFPRSEMVCSGDSRLLVVLDVDGVLRLWDL
jgi:WD40 repeat protein